MNAYHLMLLAAGLLQTPQSGLHQTVSVAPLSSAEVGFSAPSVEVSPCEHVGCADHGGECCDGCGDGASGDRHHLESTCDMPQHMAYQPMFHGYYYFRPYNDEHVLQHKALASRLGGDARAPYATAMFQRIYAATAADGDHVRLPGAVRPLPPVSPPLPDLQDLLRKADGE